MVLMWYEYALVAVIFSSILALFGYLGFKLSRVRVQKWIGGAIGNFMTNLANQAAEEESGGSSPGTSGALSLGGFQITPELLQTGMQLLKMAQEMGFIKGGTLGGGGSGGSGL